MSSIETSHAQSPEVGLPNWADFILGPGVELPVTVTEYMSTHIVPHELTRTDEENCLRMMTNTGMYDGEDSILTVLAASFPEAR